MFSIGNAVSEDDEKMDDVPVVHLTDPPEALRLSLLVLITSGFSTLRWLDTKLPQKLPFAMFHAIMRIAHKYEAVDIMHMHSYLLGKMAKESRRGPWGDNNVRLGVDELRGSHVVLLFSNDDAIEALDLARCVGAEPSIVAAMLWQCCVQGPLYLRDGITRDGIVRRLSEEDYVRCIAALPQLLLARRDLVLQTARSTDSLVARRPCSAKGPTWAEDSCDKYTRNPPPMKLERGEGSVIVPYNAGSYRGSGAGFACVRRVVLWMSP